jgi:hypothetical protein
MRMWGLSVLGAPARVCGLKLQTVIARGGGVKVAETLAGLVGVRGQGRGQGSTGPRVISWLPVGFYSAFTGQSNARAAIEV